MLTAQSTPAKPDPEVVAKAKRRRFSAEDKRRYLREYEATPKGERGALLRRYGLYSSHIETWRKQAASGVLNALQPRKRGPKAQPKPDPEVERLQRENARLTQQLNQARKVIEVQKKVSEILGVDQNLPDDLKDFS
jgi:transposase-like protein